MKIYSCDQMRQIEENANRQGMSFTDMMENAGIACFEEICSIIGNSDKKKITVLCGSGKNGGDGFVIARHLHNAGFKVNVILTCRLPKAEEAVEMFTKVNSDNIIISDYANSITQSEAEIKKSDVIVDCIFGIGFRGALRGNSLLAVRCANAADAVRISVDIPSGLEGDSNVVIGEYFNADFTLAVTCKKPVHALKPTADYCGEVRIVDIGFSQECYETVDCL